MRLVKMVCTLLALASVSLAGLSSSVFGQTATPPKSSASVHVYLVRGLLNVFSLGLDSIAEKLRRHGIEATVHNHMEWLLLADQAVQACKSGRESEIMVVGHSLGASAVVEMANRMGEAGVQSSLVVSIDPVVRVVASGHVGRLVNYYVSNGVGQPVERGASFHGSLQNIDLKNTPDGGHFMTNSDAIQQRVADDVLASVRSGHVGCRIGATHAAEKPVAVVPPHS